MPHIHPPERLRKSQKIALALSRTPDGVLLGSLKNVDLTSCLKLQWRGEVYNAVNRANLGSRLPMKRHLRPLLFALAMVAAVVDATAYGQTQQWVATWGTAQSNFRAAPAPPPLSPPPGTPAAPAPGPDPRRRHPIPPSISGLNNQTVRMIVRASLGGETVRVRLQHAFGAPSVTIGAAHIARREKDSAIVAGSDRALTFGGRPAATLYGGQTLVSDPVKLSIKPLADLAVSLYLPGDTGPPSSHTFGLRPTYISKPGNAAGDAAIADPEKITESWYWLAGVDVSAGSGPSTR